MGLDCWYKNAVNSSEYLKMWIIYEKLAGSAGKNVGWFDITGYDEWLREIGIDPQKAFYQRSMLTSC
jgi:hypothetical protein